ncbi:MULTISPECIES: formyl transferase [Burkholderia]|uniref:phosphoribosylglycinamide formyltransferase 1 n=1 Tax=Burkholderia cepacia TaxID=292 RepID=A0AA88YVL6_BURCE|nr:MULTISPECIES: formyl transferase [Burkholderia]KGB92084.1 formyl transferase family protein [Burkholderia cepacia]KWE59336.1 formyl transferase [Burkholderia sp. MSMB2157WGS]
MTDITLLCSDGPHHLYLATEILNAFGQVRVIVEPGREQASRLLRKGHYRAYFWTRYHEWRRKLFGYDTYRRRYFLRDDGPQTWDALRRQAGVRYLETSWINDTIVLDALREKISDVYIVMGTKKIGTAVLSLVPSDRIVNIHGGHLPYYRGNHCFFFALHHGELDKLSTTIHRVSAGLDTGAIISRHSVRLSPDDNSETLYSRAERAAVDSLVARLKRDSDIATWNSEPQPDIGSTYRMRDRGPLVELVHHLSAVRRRLAAGANRGKETG